MTAPAIAAVPPGGPERLASRWRLLERLPIPWRVAVTAVPLVAAAALLPELLAGDGRAGAGAVASRVVAVTLLAWTRALATVAVVALSLVRVRGRRSGTTSLLVLALLPAAGFAAALAFAGWAFTAEALAGGDLLWRLWCAGRVYAAVAIGLGAALLSPRSLPALDRPSRRFAFVAGAATLATALAWLLAPGLHPAVLPALALAADVVGLGALHRFPGTRRRVLARSLVGMQVPAVLCDLQALRAGGDLSAAFLSAQLLEVAGAVVLGLGILADYLESLRESERARDELHRARATLDVRSRELSRAGAALAAADDERSRALDRLRMLEKAVETMSVGLTISDPDGRILYANPAEAAMHGYTPAELVGASSAIFAPTPPRARRSGRAISRPWMRETVNATRDGRHFPVRLFSDAVLDDGGRTVAVVTLCEDIEQEQRAREALARRDRVLEAVELATERFLRGGLTPGNERDVLDRLRRATGVDRAHLTHLDGDGDGDVMSESAAVGATDPAAIPRRALFARLRPLLAGGRPWFGPARQLPDEVAAALQRAGVRSLALVPVLLAGEPWGVLGLETADEGRVWSELEVDALVIAGRLLAAAVESQSARAALEESESRHRRLVEAASDLIVSVDGDGRLVFVNAAWRRRLGWSAEQAAGMPIATALRPDAVADALQKITAVFADGASRTVETVFRSRSGEDLEAEGNVSLQHAEGGAVAALGIFRDVSARRRLERLKDEFIATVSHELRTPLTSVLGSVALLRSPRVVADRARVDELLELAQRNGDRLLRLINDLLDVQKLAAGRLRFHLADLALAEIFEDAASAVAATAESHGVRLAIAAGDEVVRGDRERLIQVLLNLLANSVRHAPEGSTVELAASRGGEAVTLTVGDRGPGIAREVQARLFEPFVQADAGRVGGAGLGLHIAKQLVEGMGGTIAIAARDGGGTIVAVTLPCATPSAPRGELA